MDQRSDAGTCPQTIKILVAAVPEFQITTVHAGRRYVSNNVAAESAVLGGRLLPGMGSELKLPLVSTQGALFPDSTNAAVVYAVGVSCVVRALTISHRQAVHDWDRSLSIKDSWVKQHYSLFINH